MLLEYQFHLTVEESSGNATAYLLKLADSDNAWQWVADTEFGPFDTTMDVVMWLQRELYKHAPRRLR